jgi:DNA repair protein RecN (Recombination protein N)
MNAEQFSSALGEAEAALHEGGTFTGRVNAALRKLERRRDQAGGRLDRVCQALDRLVVEASEAESALAEAQRSFAFDSHALEKADERLFALRAAARKYKCSVEHLPETLERFDSELKAIGDGAREEKRLAAVAKEANATFEAAAKALSARRITAARELDTAVAAELAPLKLERARFETRIDSDATRAGVHGFDRVEFLVAANPGTPLAPLMKVASGGELARFMLALKVILAAKGSAPTLIFDEIDTGVGGAVADAVGSRLARLAKGVQVLAVTHSPQVAARAGQHFLISKIQEVDGERMVTRVHALSSQSRREEIARMLSGAKVTKEARAQAERLISGRG